MRTWYLYNFTVPVGEFLIADMRHGVQGKRGREREIEETHATLFNCSRNFSYLQPESGFSGMVMCAYYLLPVPDPYNRDLMNERLQIVQIIPLTPDAHKRLGNCVYNCPQMLLLFQKQIKMGSDGSLRKNGSYLCTHNFSLN